ncbi:MAG: HD-GYP domain-containing protein [Betaproteobacteria bacterium]|nr:MAG: HD-GYP domain-containing protein [Betaproteobacteria bacterium]
MKLKLGTHDLKVGMYVAELDRPWLDTPFLMQGFLIQTPEHVDIVREHCSYVYVDPDRSDADALPPGLQTKKPAHTPASASHAAVGGSGSTTLVAIGQKQPSGKELSDTGRFMRMAQGGDSEHSLSASAKRLVKAIIGMRATDESPSEPIRHAFIPPSIKLEAHSETRSIAEEFDNALKIFDKAKYAMNRMVADILAGKPLVLDNVEAVVGEVVDSMLRNADALMWVAMRKQQDATLYGHGIRSAVYLVSLGRHLGLPTDYLLRLGILGALLDIGKTSLPLAILTQTGQLTDQQFELIRGHVQRGLELIKDAPTLHEDVIQGIAQHHEREDGSGYPNGLTGETISLFGRMAAIVDTFVALTNERPYAEPLSPYAAFRKISEWSRTLFHAPLTEQFIHAIGAFPVGSIVEMSSGETAVVVRQNQTQRLKPQILVVCGPDKEPLREPYRVDLCEQGKEKKAKKDTEPLRIARGLPSGSHGIDERNFQLT